MEGVGGRPMNPGLFGCRHLPQRGRGVERWEHTLCIIHDEKGGVKLGMWWERQKTEEMIKM